MLAIDPGALHLAQSLVERMLGRSVLDRSYELTRSGSDVSDYLSYKRNEQSREASTLDQYERDLARLCTTYATREPTGIGTDDIRAVRDTYPEGSRHRVTAVYRDFFQWLYEEGRILSNPAARIRYPKRKPAPITDLFTDIEKAAIVAAQETIRDRACVLLLLRAGLRKGELRHLRVRDIDLSSRLILVRRGKGSKHRRIPIRGLLVQALDEYLLTDIPGLGRQPQGTDHILYPSRGGNQHGTGATPVPEKPMAQSTAHRWWYACLERAGIVEHGVTRGRRTHTTRHTYATDLGRATNWNMLAVQKNLGHSSIQQTVDTYTQFVFADQEDAVDQMPEIQEV